MTAPYTPTTPELPALSRLRTGALTFAALAVAGLVGVFILAGHKGPPLRLADLHVGFMLLALASAVADAVLSGLRFQIFIRRNHPRSPLSLPIRADLAGRFVAAVTPSQFGGGPAQVFILHRGSVPVAETLSFLHINLISSFLALLLVASLSARLYRDHFGEDALLRLFQYSFFLVLAGLGVVVAMLACPEVVSRPLKRLARRGDRGPGQLPTLLGRVADLLVNCLGEYRIACRRFVRDSPWLLASNLALTLVLYLNKFGLAWLVMRALGAEQDFAMAFAVVTLIHFCVLLAPTPGSGGVSELAHGTFLAILLPGSLIGPFTLAYRLLTVYLPAAVGAYLLMAELGSRGARARAPMQAAPVLGLVLALSTGAAGAAGAAEPTAGPAPSCPLCREGAWATTPLLRAEVEAAAESLAARNRRDLDRIGSLLHAGDLGPPESREARARAHLLARMTLTNWYSFLLPFVADSERVYAVAPEAIAPVASRYCEALAVPMPRLRELRLGRGHVCARYDLGAPEEEGWTVVGGQRLRYRVVDRKVGGVIRRVLSLDWRSTGMGKVEVLVEEHYGFRLAETRLSDDDGDRCALFMALEVTGVWIRRHGVHRPEAFAFWATRPSDDAPSVPGAARVGAAIYLPGLRLSLPLFPDIEFDDVRLLGLPMPFLDADDLRRGVLPSWLPSEGDLTLAAWTSEGPLPPALRGYFPELRTGRRVPVTTGPRASRSAGSMDAITDP